MSNTNKINFEGAARNIKDTFKVTNASTATTNIDLVELLKSISDYEVLVGIPEDTSQRKDAGQGMTNAELAFIHTNGVRTNSMIKEMKTEQEKTGSYTAAYKMYLQAHGSPAYKIPPRPIIEPAIEANIDSLTNKLMEAMVFFLDGEEEKGLQQLEKVGMTAQNFVRAWFTDPRNGWAPNSPATIKRKTKGKGGETMPLIDTGALRKSISYVVRDLNTASNKSYNIKKVKKLLK
jgi:hypothetical protein